MAHNVDGGKHKPSYTGGMWGGSFFKEHKYTKVRQLRQQHAFDHHTDQNCHPSVTGSQIDAQLVCHYECMLHASLPGAVTFEDNVEI